MGSEHSTTVTFVRGFSPLVRTSSAFSSKFHWSFPLFSTLCLWLHFIVSDGLLVGHAGARLGFVRGPCTLTPTLELGRVAP